MEIVIVSIIIGVVLIVIGRSDKEPNGKINKKGRIVLIIGVVLTVVGLIPFTMKLINAFTEGFSEGFTSVIERSKSR
ncbi:MAG: hypothetical protein ISS47_02625 [Candidatus Omnitrophica bacterium]|nr:hypothetical protein [Candidatus Omnitrophota bacterium]